MKIRSLFLTVMAFLALVIGGSVQAQDDAELDLCFGLSEDDCTVINEASANGFGGAESFTIDFDIDFAGDELGGLFGLLGGFAPDLDLGALGEISSATFTATGSFDVIPGDSDDMSDAALSGSFVTTFSQNGGEVTEVAMDFIAVDEMLYINLGDGWSFVDPEQLEDSEAMSGLGLPGMGGDDMEDMEEATAGLDMGALGGIFGLLDLPGFVVYERAGDTFSFAVDFSVLQQLLEEENEDLLNELVTTAAEIDPTFAFLIPLLPTLISDGELVAVQTVDTDANIVTDINFGADLDLALGILEGNPAITTIDLTAGLSFSNFDGVDAIEAPADATDGTDAFAEWLSSLFPAPVEEEAESGD